MTTAAMPLILGYLAYRFVQTGRVIRVLWTASQQPSVPARYVLFQAPIGPMIALFDDVG